MNDCSNLGNADVDVSGCGRMGDIGVKGGVGVVIVDAAEIDRGLLGGGSDNKSAVDTELRVDIDARLSSCSVRPRPPPDLGFGWVAWKSAWGGSEPKT